jgi:ubiquinone/menaquinone biosynthesis C-methylase UbiE
MGEAMGGAAREVQRRYYQERAGIYDSRHVSGEDEHSIALRFISSFIELFSISTILDVGCGTGRGIKHLRERHPGTKVIGIEPVWEMLDQAEKKSVPKTALICADGFSLPFRDASFDAVCEFGILHHMPRPNDLVKEMLRVARRAVFLSDGNRFGQGSRLSRVLKLLLYKSGLWKMANWVRRGGKDYTFSEGDGVAYSYSVFDSYGTVSKWAERIILIPTRKLEQRSWFHPLLTSDHILMCGIRNWPTDHQ